MEYVYVLGKHFARVDGNLDNSIRKKYFYHTDHLGSTVAVTDEAGQTVWSGEYTPFGGRHSTEGELAHAAKFTGKDLDEDIGLYYFNARWYDSATSRMLSEDTHWNPENMIYGDNPVKINEWQDPLGFTNYNTYAPDINAIRQSTNLYVYCMNSPLTYTDPTGHRSKEAADKIIKDNAQYIKDAAAEFGIDPAILAACIYTEQRLNVDWKDDLTDRPLYFLDTSIGISQVRISTAKMLEDAGYMLETQSYKIYANRIVVSREEAIADKLMDNLTNVKYAAAYLAYWQDQWKDVYPEINERTAILATLFNLGKRANEPNSNPQSIPFGDFAEENYNHMRSLLGLDEGEKQ